MLRHLTFLLLLLLTASILQAQDKVIQRIFLVGDAGEMYKGKHPVCDWLTANADWNDSTNTILYLGDNIYPLGMPAPGSKGFEAAKQVFDYQISVVKDKNAKAFFVPGNHDWRRGRPGGLAQINHAFDYLQSLQLPNVQILPEKGCPGPVEVPLGEKVLLVFMDSEWWLEQNQKPGVESDCDCKNEDEVITALKDIVSSNPDKLIVLAMHHPFHTHGEHGGYYTFKQHIFPLTDLKDNLYIPLPIIGSIYPIARGWFGSVQDVRNPLYRTLIEKTEEVTKGHHNVVHVAGHEHTLQLLSEDSMYYVVSGSGSKRTRVKSKPNTLFAKAENGFAAIEVVDNGNVQLKYYTINESSNLDKPVFVQALPAIPELKEIHEENKELVASFPDSITVTRGEEFKASGFKKFLLGPNYRDDWSTPVKVEVFDLAKVLGGLKPLKRGGGHQSRSLRFADSTGKQWVLRTVQKFVTDAALPADLRGTIAKDLVADGISASYPYAALSVPVLATAAGVPHATPKLYYVPDDPRLGKFRTDFANMLCLFEEREPGGYKKTTSTIELIAALQKDNDNIVDQHAVLQARLLDMFMMDFDRHEDQWRWASEKEDKAKTFFPLPRDRDQPFFVSKGVIPWFARKPYVSPQIQGFRSKALDIRPYNFNARNFDRAFMNELNESDWKKAVDAFLPAMSDSIIETALRQQPKEILTLSNAQIIQKLKDRRKYFEGEMMQYYRFLAKIVNIPGSDKNEQFEITRNEDGTVLVQVLKINKEGELSSKMYDRLFDPADTKELRLYGMGGDDKFIFKGKGDRIKVRAIGGSGEDLFESNSTASEEKTIVYDLRSEKNSFAGNENLKKELSDDPAVNNFERRYYKYNLNIPFLSANFNIDDGLYLGASMRLIRHGFRKTPYKEMHQFVLSHSLSTNAFNIKYNADFIQALGKSDLLIRSELKAPNNVQNFFGYGNTTVYDKNAPGKIKFYRARFTLADAALLLRKNAGRDVSLSVGPALQVFSMDGDDNEGRFITKSPANGLDSTTLYKTKTWFGGQLMLSIDNRNNKVLPTRGVNWQTSIKALKGVTGPSKGITQANSDFALYMSFAGNPNIVLADRVGAGINFGDFEFYQAQYLSGTDNLRGFRKYRFAGRSMLYNNLELRIKIADFRTYLFPGAFGVLGFYDAGTVWAKGDPSAAWHHGYGGGLWIAPMKKLVITASYAASKEGGLPLLTFGWLF